MPLPPPSDQILQETLSAFEQFDSKAAAAAALGIPVSTYKSRLKAALDKLGQPQSSADVVYPLIPEDDIPTEQIIAMMAKRSQKRLEAAAARDWQTIKLRTKEPVVIAFVGDPHLDDDGTDWTLLQEHIALMRRPHVYAVNIGDTTNSWGGKLVRLYANQETSKKTSRKLAKWFLMESGINWLVWLAGNHEEMDSSMEVFRAMNTTGVPMEDWQARFRVEFSNGFSVPIWAAHDFKYKSQYNKLHGPQRAARERRGAALYVCGHHHDFGLAVEEQADTGEVFWTMRVRGYKMHDQHAIRWGFDSKRYGSTGAAVIDPRTDDPVQSVQCFMDLATAIRYRDSIA